MFYNRTRCAFYIQDIFEVSRKPGVYENKRRDFAGLAFRLAGGSVFVTENGRTEAPEGSITYIPPGVDFNIESGEEEVIIFHLGVFGEKEKEIVSITPSNPERFAEFFKSATEEWGKRKIGYKNRCTAILYSLFAALEKENISETDKSKELIKKGILYINRYYDKKYLTMEDVANKCNISQVYFRRLFKEEYGMSPLKYINHLRIKRAKKLLESGYYQVSEVASLSGFEDVKYFSTAFKKSVGISPNAYLKKERND